MPADSYTELREELERKKEELTVRLEKITANLRRGYHADSKERAKELEDSEVVDALGNEARGEIRDGLRIAREQTAPDLLTLPVAAPEAG